MPNELHYFSAIEYKFQQRFRAFRDRFLKLLIAPLVYFRIKPNTITLVSFLSILVFAYFLVSSPYVAVLFLLVHIALDGIDGVLARALHESGRAGAFLDILNDHSGLVVVVLALVYNNFVNPTLGILYVYLYSLLIALLLYSNSLGIPPVITLRTKYFLYCIYLVWVFLDVSYFQAAVMVFTILTTPFVVITIVRVFFSLNKRG